ncbi:MAG: hypothetical protein RBU30_23515 [Polyangia bacterium]|jgi:hypothetical protein|nr:hypothetical protein [Polyangia bacterium]
MPIVTLSATTLEQVCAGCGQVNRIRLDDLALGVSIESEQRRNKDVIRLPECPACGAQEHLLRTWDAPSGPGAGDVRADAAGSAASAAGALDHQAAHRRVVNRLGAMLKERRQVDRRCADSVKDEAAEPPDIHPDTPTGRRSRIDIGPPPWAQHLKERHD